MKQIHIPVHITIIHGLIRNRLINTKHFTANISEMVTDSASITIVIKYEVASGLAMGILTFNLGLL